MIDTSNNFKNTPADITAKIMTNNVTQVDFIWLYTNLNSVYMCH